ncbi:MAG: ABC transporter ATP-binding protein [Nonlabens sp.]
MQLKDYRIGYGHCEVARCDGDLAFAKAEFISIIGKNGAGKSTLLQSINDKSLRLSGNVALGDQNYDSLLPAEKAKITSVVLTERNFSHFLKVRELLELSRAPYTSYYGKLSLEDHDIIDRVLDQFELRSLSHRSLGTLSDGQLQRVLIARSLAQDTSYILMDEPTSHLDINYKVDLLLMLKKYCDANLKTMIYATHELQLAMQLSDKIVSIYQGIIELQSTKDFASSNKLKEMFPSKNISFKNGKIDFSF